MIKILILSNENHLISQMTEGYLKKLLDHNVKIYSAGIVSVKETIDKNAIHIMKEVNIDITSQTINIIHEYKSIKFDYVITVYEDSLATNSHLRENAFVLIELFRYQKSMEITMKKQKKNLEIPEIL